MVKTLGLPLREAAATWLTAAGAARLAAAAGERSMLGSPTKLMRPELS
ncbi:MAG: hypothetical protein ACRDNW_08470 [Trebonia sp.]